MAISMNYRTAVSLDRYARIMGINPVHFCGGTQIQLSDGRILFPLNNAQNNIWSQESWQNSDQVSREELSQALYEAELEVEKVLGYHTYPKWIEDEEKDLSVSYRHDISGIQYDSRDSYSLVKLNMGKFISGGRRKLTFIANVRVSYEDGDGDGWNEQAKLDFSVAGFDYSNWNLKNVKVYFEGKDGENIYEIRDCKKIYIDGTGTMHILFDSWLLIDYELQLSLPTNDRDGKSIDMTDSSSFVSAVDVYYEENDYTQNHVEFYSGDDVSIFGGYIYQPRFENQHVVPVPGQYIDGEWVKQSCSHDVKKCCLFYYSGNNYKKNIGYSSTDKLDPYLAIIISYIATARLPRIFYANNNATALAAELRVDLNSRDSGTKYPIKDIIDNPFGTKEGEVRAWRKLNKFMGNKLAFTTI